MSPLVSHDSSRTLHARDASARVVWRSHRPCTDATNPNARRRDEITANLDRLAINSPDTYTTLVGPLVRLTRDLLGMENPTTSVWL